MLRFALIAILSGGCTLWDDGVPDAPPPITGERHRFVVDRIDLPLTIEEARAWGQTLDEDELPDNVLGQVIATARNYGEEAPRANLALGAITATVEIQADDLERDDDVGISFYGHDGAAATPARGHFTGGDFVGDLIGDDGTHPGSAIIDLPIFQDADPSRLEAFALQVQLTEDGEGGYTAYIAGGVRRDNAVDAAVRASLQMVSSRPELHRPWWLLLDRNRDGLFSEDELADNIIESLISPDISVQVGGERHELVSFGVRMHLTPCAEGRCASPAPTCFDRLRNGDETDVDCGGACGGCAGGKTCSASADCQSNACGSGVCTPVSCGDGIKNGLEADIDCGGACGAKCAIGDLCGYHFDCATNACSNTTSSGVCLAN